MNKPLVINRARVADADEVALARYKALMKLDRSELDSAAEEQAQLYMEVSEKHVDAVSVRDKAKSDLALIDAELAIAVRRNHERKQSEGAVYDEVITNPKHRAAAADYERKRHIAEKWGALCGDFEMRSKMIQQLTQQFSTGYFSINRSGSSAHKARTTLAGDGREALHNHRTKQ